jgi:hypothetical protein
VVAQMKERVAGIHVKDDGYTIYSHRSHPFRVTGVTPQFLVPDNGKIGIILDVNYFGSDWPMFKGLTLTTDTKTLKLDFITIPTLREVKDGKHREWGGVSLTAENIATIETMLDDDSLKMTIETEKKGIDCTWDAAQLQWTRELLTAYRVVDRDRERFKRLFRGPLSVIE